MRTIFLLGLTSLLTDVSSEMVYPLIPFFLTSLGAGPAALGLIEGFAESLSSLLKVFSGYVSDRAGRRKPLTITGYALSGLGKVILAVAGGWGAVFCARSVDRLGKGVRTAPRDALIAESGTSEKRGRAFGLHRGMDTAGAVIGVALALAVLGRAGSKYSTVFLTAVIPAALGVAALFPVREGARSGVAGKAAPRVAWKPLPGNLKRFLLVALVFTLGNSSNTFLLLRASGEGMSPAGVLLLYLAYNVSYMLWSYPAGWLSDRIGRKRVLAAGYAVYGIVYLGFAAGGQAPAPGWMLWTLFAGYGVYAGLTDGIEKAFVADLAPPELRGTAIGLHATIAGAGLLPASLVAGLLWEHMGPASPFVLGGALGLIASAAVLLAVRGGTSAVSPAL